jgi:hypothetical protein
MAKIKIGPLYYRVQEVKDLFDGPRKLDGRISYSLTTIQIDSTLGFQARNHTLLHEIVHGVAGQLGFPDLEEELVDRIAFAAYQVIRDNPEFVRLLIRKEKKA